MQLQHALHQGDDAVVLGFFGGVGEIDSISGYIPRRLRRDSIGV
jgi:hypothetical protein